MDIVIKISEDSYKATCNGCMLPPDVENVVQGIKNGIIFPKGHRLMDADKFVNSLKGIKRLHIDDELRSSILDAVNTNILVEADKECERQT